MEIIVEIGTSEQQLLIKQEIENFIVTCDIGNDLQKIIVPNNFDETINKIKGTTNYSSIRSHIAMAKILDTTEGTVLVFSPYLYFSSEYDTQVRLLTYMHELTHAINKQRILNPIITSQAKKLYFDNLYILYDEYDAIRQQYKLSELIIEKIFSGEKSPLYLDHIKNCNESFLKGIKDHSKYYDLLQKEIFSFRSHRDINIFINTTKEYFDTVSKDIIYFYAYVDHFNFYERYRNELMSCSFINKSTLALIDLFRNLYNKKTPDLLDGIALIQNYMMLFGIQFVDTQTNDIYCKVLDI